jgi:hypothetical protein
MSEQDDTLKEQPNEYKKFEAGLKQVISVSKEELDRRLKADKEKRQSAGSPDTK